jgi:5,6-dimethylbenzimidazole synthase
MILGGWAALLLIAANSPHGELLGNALVEGQLYFAGRADLTGALLLALISAMALPWLMPRLLRARLLPQYEAANRLPAWRWHLGFDLLVAGAMAVATASMGLMAAFALVLVPAWIAFRIAIGWRRTLAWSSLIGLLAYLSAFTAALLLDQPFGPHHAPSVGFMQPWDFVLVEDHSIRAGIKSAFEQAHAEAAEQFPEQQRERYRGFKLEGILEAPLGICVTCDRGRNGPVVIGRTSNPEMDLYSSVCAVQNLWLAARAEGIGVGWVSIIDHARLRELLEIPPTIDVIAYLCVGYVRFFRERPELETAGWLDRAPLESIVHRNRWSG